jgi:hypothetical protein
VTTNVVATVVLLVIGLTALGGGWRALMFVPAAWRSRWYESGQAFVNGIPIPDLVWHVATPGLVLAAAVALLLTGAFCILGAIGALFSRE